ncbi:MAG TPA: nucleotidyltransferase [Thermoanaerobaculia bacterium]|nr:nucleotidyltransferase [Thermoanaerobaculia bacterium]
MSEPAYQMACLEAASDTRADASAPAEDLPQEARAFYRSVMERLQEGGVPFLVAGAYALSQYTGVVRHTKDFDVFIMPEDVDRALELLAAAGYEVERFSPHWLAKATCGDNFVDLIYNSGNGATPLDQRWFDHARTGNVLGVEGLICPPEEMIWSKAFLMERERYDGADVAHLLRSCSPTLDWARLLERFGTHWRVLLGHLVLFGFIYPDRRHTVPRWVMEDLGDRLMQDLDRVPVASHTCWGTLLSRVQYQVDLEELGYRDGRLEPKGNMSREDIELWRQRAEEDAADGHH